MSFTIEHMRPEEYKYAYHSSDYMNVQTGCIGCFHGNLTLEEGICFNRYWDSFNPSRQTREFEGEFIDLVQALKTEKKLGRLLSGKKAMQDFCHKNKDARIESPYKSVFGFRIETERHLFLIRIDARSDNEDFFIYAFDKSKFVKHLDLASDGILFTGQNEGSPRFTIADGDDICIRYPDGSYELKHCRFIGWYEVELNGQKVFLKDFLADMDDRGCQLHPIRKSLPDVVYFCNEDGQMMEIRPGQDAIRSPLNFQNVEANRKMAERFNKTNAVTPAQYAAMVYGVTHSWADQDADPAYYDDEGNPTF